MSIMNNGQRIIALTTAIVAAIARMPTAMADVGRNHDRPAEMRPRSLVDVTIERLDLSAASSLKFTSIAGNNAALGGGRVGAMVNSKLYLSVQGFTSINEIRPSADKGAIKFSYLGATVGTTSAEFSDDITAGFLRMSLGAANIRENNDATGATHQSHGYFLEPEIGRGWRLLPHWGIEWSLSYRFVAASRTPSYSGDDFSGLTVSLGTLIWL